MNARATDTATVLPDDAPVPASSFGPAPNEPLVIDKYTGVLAAADVFTPDVAFWPIESIRLNRGYGLQVHP